MTLIKHPECETRERGSGLIIVILVVAFMFSMGIAMMTISAAGKRVADNVRSQKQAFNAAEAGFDAAWTLLNSQFVDVLLVCIGTFGVENTVTTARIEIELANESN
ncbi:MAG: hypothetical protein MUP70_11345 [Candidatus Aminicenantes bacterium]|nr:hypothetical protein [Candidatus Aminicenantes bacterium]